MEWSQFDHRTSIRVHLIFNECADLVFAGCVDLVVAERVDLIFNKCIGPANIKHFLTDIMRQLWTPWYCIQISTSIILFISLHILIGSVKWAWQSV